MGLSAIVITEADTASYMLSLNTSLDWQRRELDVRGAKIVLV
jgi:hypothetical protein